MQLLAAVTRRPWRGRRAGARGPSQACWRSGRAGCGVRRGASAAARRCASLFLLGARALPARDALLRPASCCGRLRLRCGGGFPPPCARFRGARLPGARARPVRCGFDFLALLRRLRPACCAVLLFEHVALDVGLLAAHFDVHRARAALRARLLELALRLARQRDLARRGGAASCSARRRHARGAGASAARAWPRR